MTTSKPAPASDQSVKWLRDSWITDVPINHGSMIAEIPIRELQGMILRIEADRARIRELEDLIIGKDEHFPACCCAFDEARREIKAKRNAALSKPEPGR